ncbi:hypothetical protein VNO78_18788 [Psophocarpus tetragonolobus]|uniref:Reverse transcriptase zinc-binding domain-containing protein n=1 Tax=Psophocarpus tetragonolobus TaxID=3891 RepID=A0AAN9XFY9_PSOTE
MKRVILDHLHICCCYRHPLDGDGSDIYNGSGKAGNAGGLSLTTSTSTVATATPSMVMASTSTMARERVARLDHCSVTPKASSLWNAELTAAQFLSDEKMATRRSFRQAGIGQGMEHPFWSAGEVAEYPFRLWKTKVPAKVVAFSWKVALNNIPSKVELARQSILAPSNTLCPLCGVFLETTGEKFLVFPGYASFNRKEINPSS